MPSVKTRVGLFLLLLGVVLAFFVLVASGVLRFGLEGPSIFLLYLVAGLVAAFGTFGLLGGVGELKGDVYGVTVRLGGAVVALVLVPIGGGWYELRVRPPKTVTAARFAFREGGAPQKVSGKLTLLIGTQVYSSEFEKATNALVDKLPAGAVQHDVSVDLESVEWERLSNTPIVLRDDAPIDLEVKRRAYYEKPGSSVVELTVENASVAGVGTSTSNADLTLVVRAVSKCTKPVPIARHAVIRAADGKAAPVELGFSGDGSAEVSPDHPTTLYFNGVVPKGTLLALRKSAALTLHTSYDPKIATAGPEFNSVAFSLEDLLRGQ